MMRVRLPFSIMEQRRIVKVLDSADEVIQYTEQYITKLRRLWREISNRLLTCGVNELGIIRNYVQKPEQFTDTVLGPVPRTWKILALGDLADYVNGYAFKPEDWGEAGLPIIRIQNINGSRDFNFFNGSIDPRIFVQPGDLLFAWSGTRDSSFGPTLWKGRSGLLNQHIFKVQENHSIIERRFLHILLKHNLERIASSAHGFKESFVHVRRSDLTSVVVGLPPLEEQRKILRIAETEESLVNSQLLKLEGLRRMRDGLMDDLLTGRVRVTGGGVEHVGTE